MGRKIRKKIKKGGSESPNYKYDPKVVDKYFYEKKIYENTLKNLEWYMVSKYADSVSLEEFNNQSKDEKKKIFDVFRKV